MKTLGQKRQPNQRGVVGLIMVVGRKSRSGVAAKTIGQKQ